MIKLSKKQRKALRNNGKCHARKHGEHRRRISNIIERRSHKEPALLVVDRLVERLARSLSRVRF